MPRPPKLTCMSSSSGSMAITCWPRLMHAVQLLAKGAVEVAVQVGQHTCRAQQPLQARHAVSTDHTGLACLQQQLERCHSCGH